ncbi:bifunctional metallophosphatase/5'-nucleotidase [Parashewanella spongiae]|uniref:Bifunctional metallophosphatase/5'-nucleotidase n=1 Tax=Parashewanella spongiae TaxID=342950 RepID=A0A3A6TD48_9GAMM|nr:bifunctional metallophosphatase/5'-nucleotidase [Parashewanella spongiae]MCL1077613.1 bifunctional metallophosphatase/5'-nucleotidase [Parashewanella spongiae]RJY13159.1 bifunctional metallophosphatase/5'-nucleotidase [Parashewanella spongiae]
MSNALIKGLVATAVLAALTGCGSDNKSTTEPTPVPPIDTRFDMTIAHINDVHSNFDAHDFDFTAQVDEADFKVRTQAGGYPRITKKLKDLRATAENNEQPFLALLGGDAFQGSLYFSLLKGEGNARLLNEMKLDGMAIGNHEFDLGNGPLIDFIEKANFPLLAANMDTSNDADMDALDNLMPYIIKEFDGVKVGVFGLVLEDLETISSPGENLIFNKEIESAQATVDSLAEQGVNKIVMVSHIGVDRDVKVAEGVNGIDVIVGGHSHSLLGDFTNIGRGSSNVAYAQMVTNPNGNTKTCIVQAGQYAEAVGKVDVSFSNGEVDTCAGGNTLLINDEFKHKYDGKKRTPLTEDDQSKTVNFVAAQSNIEIADESNIVRAIIDEDFKPLLNEFESEVVGTINDANDEQNQLDHVRIPGKRRDGASLAETGSEAGAHVAASMVWKLNNHNFNVDMAITNTGGVRDHIKEDNENGISIGYVVGSLLYFNNKLSVVTLNGQSVKKLLETTIDYGINTSDGAFPTFANIQFTYNGKAVKGERIESLQVCPGGVAANMCADIDVSQNYRIATNEYVATGKDGYTVFAEDKIGEVENAGFIDNEVMVEYIKDVKVLEEIPTGLNFIAPDFKEDGKPFIIDSPLIKPEDNQ